MIKKNTENNTELKLDLRIKSSEEIKDKDITNTVTKYNIIVEIQLKMEDLSRNKLYNRTFSKTIYSNSITKFWFKIFICFDVIFNFFSYCFK